MPTNVLVIDDNPDVVKALSVMLKLEGINCDSAYSPQEGLKKLKKTPFDLVIQDMNFSKDMTSGKEGETLYKAIRELNSDIPIIIITAWTSVEKAVSLVKDGAADYVGKPWDEDKLLITIKNLIELEELRKSHRSMIHSQRSIDQAIKEKHQLCGICYQSDAMSRLVQMAVKVAYSDVPILITGPNGAGKEKVAEIVQANSQCSSGPFIKVNVGALSKELLEAELFGAEAGAYTGITKRRIGRFEAADGGTLFLDEIGNLSHEGQIKLLRVLQSGEFERVGSNETIKVNVRVISATNSDLSEAIKSGEFREDLYYRLNVIELKVDALNSRKDDIVPLANLFLDSGYQLGQHTIELLKSYHWPGNVRELQNSIKRAMLLASGSIILPEHFDLQVLSQSGKENSDDLDRETIIRVIDENNRNIMESARQLGISRSALYRRLKKFNIEH